MAPIKSKDNPRVRRWAKLMRDGRFRRTEGRAMIEGPHLLAAALSAGLKPVAVLATDETPEIDRFSPIILSDSVFRSIMDVETPQGVAAEIAIPRPREQAGDRVYLEGVQDAGNVGAIIRSAAAFGIRSIYLDKGCADPWSPKVLRAGMGGHFALSILESPLPPVKLVCTVARGGVPLKDADLSGPLCWVFGSEGRGVSPEVQRKAAIRVTIPIEPGTESLNVAAAAAICLYEAHRRRMA